MSLTVPQSASRLKKQEADYVFYELTRSLCPECRRVIDAHIVLRDNKVYMRKRCPEHGFFESLIYGDARAYTGAARYNKPGTIPLRFSTEIRNGCPHDCGLCPDHQQHACLGIIEVNSGCNMDCPFCFADAGHGFSLTLEEVEEILDRFIEAEGHPEIVQFSGGEPSIVADLADLRAAIYFQFDGFERETYRIIRGEPDILVEKLRALDRLAQTPCPVILVPAIERGINEHEVGRIVDFGLKHPAVRGINFQPAFHAGRFGLHDPLERITIPDILKSIEAQTEGLFRVSDFVSVPCCFPTCNSVTYAYVEGDTVLPLPRLLDVEDYLDYLSNRVTPDVSGEIRAALEGLWSSATVPGTDQTARKFAISCAACNLPEDPDLAALEKNIFMIMLQDFMDPWTFSQKNLMKYCKEILLPDGKQIPFCAYNSVGYREQARSQLEERTRARVRARRAGAPFRPEPITFSFDRPSGSNGAKP